MFSLAANGLICLSDVPSDFPLYGELKEIGVTDYCRGGSAIAGPDGTWLVGPVVGEERLVVADLNLRRVARGAAELRPNRPLQPARRLHRPGRPPPAGAVHFRD